MAHLIQRRLDDESQKFLEQLGLINVPHVDPHHSVWRGSYGSTPFDIYIPLNKKCVTIGDLLYYVRGDGIGIGIKMEREKVYQKIKYHLQSIIFGYQDNVNGSYASRNVAYPDNKNAEDKTSVN
jgi:hypothetical protein